MTNCTLQPNTVEPNNEKEKNPINMSKCAYTFYFLIVLLYMRKKCQLWVLLLSYNACIKNVSLSMQQSLKCYFLSYRIEGWWWECDLLDFFLIILTFIADKVHMLVQSGSQTFARNSGRWFIKRFNFICDCRRFI